MRNEHNERYAYNVYLQNVNISAFENAYILSRSFLLQSQKKNS